VSALPQSDTHVRTRAFALDALSFGCMLCRRDCGQIVSRRADKTPSGWRKTTEPALDSDRLGFTLC